MMLAPVAECNGDFVYFGLTSVIKEKIKGGLTNDVSIQNLCFNIDGLPLHKSSNKQFWPILCKIDEAIDQTPFPVAIFFGTSKPNNVCDFFFF